MVGLHVAGKWAGVTRKMAPWARAAAPRLDSAAVESGQGAADGEAKTEAAGAAAVGLFKGVEDTFQPDGFDADARVRDLDPQGAGAFVILRAQGDRAAGRRVFHRIANEIPKDLLDAGGVGFESGVRGAQVERELEVARGNIRLADVHRAAQQIVRFDRLGLELKLAVADAGEIQQVVDQPRFELHIATDRFQRGAHGFGAILFLQQRGGVQHRGERRAQFVGKHRQETVFCRIGGLRRFACLAGFCVEAAVVERETGRVRPVPRRATDLRRCSGVPFC